MYFITENFTTNLAESYMHIRSKFDGGKQINRSQKGFWQSRCAGVALRMNKGPSWGPACWEEVTRLPPSDTFKTVAAKRSEKVSQERSHHKGKNQAEKCKSDNSLQSRLDYSRHDDGPML